MAQNGKVRTQRRIKGHTRQPLYSSYLPLLEREIRRTAEKFACSRSLVIVTAVADALGIDIGEEPIGAPRRRRANSMKRRAKL